MSRKINCKNAHVKNTDPKKFALIIDEKMSKLGEFMKTGLAFSTACRAAGVHPNTYYLWKKKAEAGDEPYATSYRKLLEARAQGEAELAQVIVNAAKTDDWKAAAWMLERRNKKTWGKNDQISLYQLQKLKKELTQATDEELEELTK